MSGESLKASRTARVTPTLNVEASVDLVCHQLGETREQPSSREQVLQKRDELVYRALVGELDPRLTNEVRELFADRIEELGLQVDGEVCWLIGASTIALALEIAEKAAAEGVSVELPDSLLEAAAEGKLSEEVTARLEAIAWPELAATRLVVWGRAGKGDLG